MDIQTLHQHLGALLAAGVEPTLPVVGITENWPEEIAEVQLLTGPYYYDPAPKLSAHVRRHGTVLALVPANQDMADSINDGTHTETELPVTLP